MTTNNNLYTYIFSDKLTLFEIMSESILYTIKCITLYIPTIYIYTHICIHNILYVQSTV